MIQDSSKLRAMLTMPEGSARKVILSCLGPEETVKSYFEPESRSVLYRLEPHSTSLKNSEQRRGEILGKLVPSLLKCMNEDLELVVKSQGWFYHIVKVVEQRLESGLINDDDRVHDESRRGDERGVGQCRQIGGGAR